MNLNKNIKYPDLTLKQIKILNKNRIFTYKHLLEILDKDCIKIFRILGFKNVEKIKHQLDIDKEKELNIIKTVQVYQKTSLGYLQNLCCFVNTFGTKFTELQ